MHSSMAATGAAAAVPWYRTVTREQWRVLLAAKFGWMLDAMDFMLYTMAVGQLRSYFGFGDDTAGLFHKVNRITINDVESDIVSQPAILTFNRRWAFRDLDRRDAVERYDIQARTTRLA